MLILDGDGIDKRNSHDGQIKTRLEAFLEMLDSGGRQKKQERKRSVKPYARVYMQIRAGGSV